ncbi:unnamed protein product [Porites lobata]|uniref:Mitochondrial folate transporter/carrier n=1 Tax=Porites lobata TaxID=104759 RepID=A0ABN8S594_9CNID|nr:unnamed protein product [Porites lobata]
MQNSYCATGYVPGLFGVSHGPLQFMAYEELKKGYSHYFGTPINKKLNQYTMAEYNGAVDVIRKTFRYEGVRGFYKGLVPNVLRVTPACALTFVVYENVIHFLMPSSLL